MSNPFGDRPFPRGPLVGAGALIGMVIVGVGAARIEGWKLASVPSAAEVSVRELRFEDRTDGGITVLEARTGQTVQVVEPGTNGFLRGALRALARERKRMGIGPEVAFRLVRRSDGHLTLEDPATGRRVDLGAFGPVNEGAFAGLMSAAGAVR